MFENSWVETVSWGLGMALFYWLVFSQLKIPVVNWETLGVAMATAGVEELVFSGFITGYLERLVKGSWTNLFLTGAMAGVMRLPIATAIIDAFQIRINIAPAPKKNENKRQNDKNSIFFHIKKL